MTLLPGAPEDNTYLVTNALRPDSTSCFGNLSCAVCPGTLVDQYGLVRPLLYPSWKHWVSLLAERQTS